MHVFGLTVNSLVLLLCPLLAVTMYLIDGSLLKAWLYLYSSFYFTVTMMFPTSLAHTLFWRQRLLITALKVVENQEPTNDPNQNVEELRTMIEIYSDFAEVFDEMSLCYGIPTMLVAGMIFLQSIVIAFAIYKNFVLTGNLFGNVLSSLLYTNFYGLLFNINSALNSLTSFQVSRFQFKFRITT